MKLTHNFARWMATVSFLLSCGAATAQAPDPDTAGSVWVAHSQGLLKVSSPSNTVVVQLSSPVNVMTVAIDLQRKVVWAYAPSRLYAFSYDGLPLFETPVAETGSPADLVVNTHDGSVWLGLGTKLIQFSSAGQRLGSLSLASSLVKLAMTQPATLWVATAQ